MHVWCPAAFSGLHHSDSWGVFPGSKANGQKENGEFSWSVAGFFTRGKTLEGTSALWDIAQSQVGSTSIIRVLLLGPPTKKKRNIKCSDGKLPLSKPPQQPWKHPLPPQPVIDKADPFFPQSRDGLLSWKSEKIEAAESFLATLTQKHDTSKQTSLVPVFTFIWERKGPIWGARPRKDSFKSLFLGPQVGQKESKNHFQNPQAPL